MSDVEALRQQLRERGYLTHGIERWFALDPWSSRTFWVELSIVALKAAALIALFVALPLTAIMAFRNFPLQAVETLALFVSYGLTALAALFLFVIAVALIVKLRPALPIDTPRALLAISLAGSAVVVAPVAYWWWRFDTPPALPELAAGAALLVVLFLVATIVVSAALLSFSIYEVRRVPAIHQKKRGLPMTVAGVLLIALLFVPAYGHRETHTAPPLVVTTPTSQKIALIAVDGLTYQIVQSRPDLAHALPHVYRIASIDGASTTERWASLGTGVRTEEHGVRAIEGVRFRGSSHVLQRISPADFVLMNLAPAMRIAQREPLPPTVRRRDYAWEIVSQRGVPSLAVNWWTTADVDQGALHSVGPESIFTGARGEPLRVDALATSRFVQSLDREHPQFATVYLPALDVILNRLQLDRSAQLAGSLRALDALTATIASARQRGYDVIVAGLPGDGQQGSAVLAASLPLAGPRSAWDVTPTLLELLGFPVSAEMPGAARGGSAARGGNTVQPRIASYGNRNAGTAAPQLNDDYYQNLKSLGYIR